MMICYQFLVVRVESVSFKELPVLSEQEAQHTATQSHRENLRTSHHRVMSVAHHTLSSSPIPKPRKPNSLSRSRSFDQLTVQGVESEKALSDKQFTVPLPPIKGRVGGMEWNTV